MKGFIDLTGQRFGKLIVVEHLGRRNNHTMFKCKCDCGGETITTSNNLRRSHTTSCGCVNEKAFREAGVKHGLRGHPLYISWIGMRNRCYYEKHNRYANYGGKGIRVCKEWKDDFKAFYDWAIENGWEKGLSIDRKENDQDYCPENCKFSDSKSQSRNRTSNIKLTINGVTKILIEWSEESGTPYSILRSRLKKGWKPEDAVYGKGKEN